MHCATCEKVLVLLYMYEYLITFILAFIVAFAATPIIRKIAFMGGAAIILGFIVSLFFDLITTTNLLTLNRELLGMLAGISVIAV